MLQKNTFYIMEIEDYTTEGSGIGRADGMAVFVPGTAVGDRVKVRIVKGEKRYAYGRVEELLSPAAGRIEPDCPGFGKCGGCLFRHIRYEEELACKQKRVTDALMRIGGVDERRIAPIVGAKTPDGYRNKAQLPFMRDAEGKIRAGFFAPRSHRVIPLETCRLESPAFAKAREAVLSWAQAENVSVYDEKTHSGLLRHLYLRHAMKTNELMVCLVANGERFPGEERLTSLLRKELPALKSVVLNVNREKTNVIVGKKNRVLWGREWIEDELCGLRFAVSPLSFYQVNRDQAEVLYGLVGELAALQPQETLLDLYCGTGTIGLTMANRVKKLIGVEVVAQAVENANKNAGRNGIENAEFWCADAAQAAQKLLQEGLRPDCVILDPPRKGCTPELIKTVAGMAPSRVVYVSCDPATLARDLSAFAETGFLVQKAIPVDMFPRTGHVETVVLITRA